ncbi:MAG: plasmid pRiA4b ORF-3 family protein [Candidatus Binatia bacterium]
MHDGKSLQIYQLKISLRDIRPTIWRRLQVRGDVTLAKLHRIIQAAMGWYDSHLHQFIVGETCYGVPSREDLSEVKDEKKVRLDQILSRPGRKMVYEYDFGDGWEQEILLEKVLQPDSKVRYPRCIGGARACPPEDCGGVPGYANFLEAIRDPRHEEHEEMLEWIGGEFDPEEFDLEEFDNALRRIR